MGSEICPVWWSPDCSCDDNDENNNKKKKEEEEARGREGLKLAFSLFSHFFGLFISLRLPQRLRPTHTYARRAASSSPDTSGGHSEGEEKGVDAHERSQLSSQNWSRWHGISSPPPPFCYPFRKGSGQTAYDCTGTFGKLGSDKGSAWDGSDVLDTYGWLIAGFKIFSRGVTTFSFYTVHRRQQTA